jgi:formate dehydrogenase accessory protein FdhD
MSESAEQDLDYSNLIRAQTRQVDIDAFKERGMKKVNVINAKKINELISQAVTNIIGRMEDADIQTIKDDKAQIVMDSMDEFKRLFSEQKKESEHQGKLQEEIELLRQALAQLTDRVRARVAESSCGLCGIENLEAVARPLPPVAAHESLEETAIFAALAALREHQPLGRKTGAAHAAAFALPAGAILHAREDVGRHNAMDKLIGALAAAGQDPAAGFIHSTARCSYEIVEKAVRAGATRLVTVSLPTSMAVARTEQAGLSLRSLARDDSVLLVHDGSAAR